MHKIFNTNWEPIKIVAYVDTPLVNECFDTHPNISCVYPGYEIEYIYTVVNIMLGLPIKWIKVNSFAEVKSALDESKADIMGQSQFVSPKYIGRWYHPPSTTYDSLALLVRERYVIQTQVFILLRCFKWDLWSAIFIFSLLCLVVRRISNSFGEVASRLENFFINSVKKFCHYFRTKIYFSLWFILVSILLSFYSNLIAVDLVAPERVKTVPFKSLPDLGQKLLTKECRFAILAKYLNCSEIYDILINPTESEKSWAPAFVKAYVTNPPLVVKDRKEMLDYVLNGSCIVGLDFLSMDAFYSRTYCDLRILSYSEELPLLSYTFYTTSKLLKTKMSSVVLSESIRAYRTYLNNKYYLKGGIPVDCRTSRTVTVKPINIKKMQDCFYVLAAGLVFAFMLAFFKRYGTCKSPTTKPGVYASKISMTHVSSPVNERKLSLKDVKKRVHKVISEPVRRFSSNKRKVDVNTLPKEDFF